MLFWLDIETTGLDASRDRILEIGMIATDDDLNVIDALPDMLIFTPLDLMKMDKSVRDMHTKSGLLEAMRNPPSQSGVTTIGRAEMKVLDWVRRVDPAGPRTLAGASVHFDRKFLDHWMPSLSSAFGYRHADVSAMREFVQRWVPGWTPPEAAGVHRPTPDLLDSINLARALRATLKENL